MAAESYFAQDYSAARRRFTEAAKTAGARQTRFESPLEGPEGESLSCDLAWLGPQDAERVLVTISGTHGVEGFCGNGCQVAWLESGLAGELPAGTAQLHIHAINPHGFAWLRRVTEDNVDLNRNFVDHGAAYPENPGYEALKDAICPESWDDSVIAQTQKTFDDYVERHGQDALRQAISAGQYSHDEGIFYGGRGPTWSHRVLRRIFAEELARTRKVAVIDFHTGLGPRGYGERICVHAANSPGHQRAQEWFDGDVTSPALGTSSSVEICGPNVIGMEAELPNAELTAVALEYGTIPSPEVRLALRADNWLHVHGEVGSKKGQAIKGQIRDAFYQDAPDWKEMIWERAVETTRAAVKGLQG
ncbi:MAG: M14 family metallopeptidase [Pseudomonadota bacterium]